jgi:hypothetical protein
MTLEESTAWAEAALKAGDLEDLTRAIQARHNAIAEALASGQPPPPQVVGQVIEAGERLCVALDRLKRELNLESVRFRRLQDGFAPRRSQASHISLRG